MKTVSALVLACIFAANSSAETIVCSYGPYPSPGQSASQKPVLVEVRIDKDFALVGPFAHRYRVLENSKHGIVLAYSFAAPEVEGRTPSIGAFVFAIDRQRRTMVRNNIIIGEPDAYREGTCTFIQ